MITIELEEFPGVDHILNNIETYKEKFLKETIVGFRNAYCNREDQQKIFQAFGDVLGWSPNTNNPSGVSNYEETHQNHMTEERIASADEYMLGWHVEHVMLKNDTYIGASWCMNLFNCKPGAGYTYFVDMLSLYNSLSHEDKEFLMSATVELRVRQDKDQVSHEYPLIQSHWDLGSKVIRAYFYKGHTRLKLVNGQPAKKEEQERFENIFNHILSEVHYNENIRMIQKWQEGDMLILDMFRLAHAIGGGFSSDQRKLSGIFGHLNPNWSSTQPEYY
jgi:alpha-ketoglutarate-dependent taurine dioxygenase